MHAAVAGRRCFDNGSRGTSWVRLPGAPTSSFMGSYIYKSLIRVISTIALLMTLLITTHIRDHPS